MSGDPLSITELRQHLSGNLDGNEVFAAFTPRRATNGGYANVGVTISQITNYVVANGGGGGGLSAIANNTVLGNTSGSSAVPVATNAAALSTMLGLAAIATTPSGANLTDGTVALGKIASIADQRILGNNSGSSAAPSALTPTAVAGMIPAATLTLSQLATQANNTVLGNISGSSASPVALTQANVTALINAFVGDSGSGGTKGAVPAPASGDAAAAKFLKADGTWAVPSGSGLTSQANNTLFGNLSGSAAVPGSLTAAQANAIIGTPLTSAPGSPTDGQLATADGVNWNPLNRVGGRPYRVIYSNGLTAWLPDTPNAAFPGYVSGRWYMPPCPVTTGTALTANVIRFVPFTVTQTVTISQLAARLSTNAASTHVLAGIYASSPTTLGPTGTPLSTCTFDTSVTAGTITATLGANITLTPGTYWMASLSDGTPTLTSASTGTGFASVAHFYGSSSAGNLWLSTSQFNAGYSYSTSVTYAGGLIDMTGKTMTDVGNVAICPVFGFLVA